MVLEVIGVVVPGGGGVVGGVMGEVTDKLAKTGLWLLPVLVTKAPASKVLV